MRPSRSVLLGLFIWVAVAALIYVLWWTPSSASLDGMPAGQRALILKLPDDGLLTKLIDKGSVVTLAVAVPAVEAKPAAPAAKAVGAIPAASPADPLPAAIVRVDHALIYTKSCDPATPAPHRISVCYAVAGVPEDQIEPFLRAPDKVWIWVEKQSGGTPANTTPVTVPPKAQDVPAAPAKETPKKGALPKQAPPKQPGKGTAKGGEPNERKD